MRIKISNHFLMFEADSRSAEPLSIQTLQDSLGLDGGDQTAVATDQRWIPFPVRFVGEPDRHASIRARYSAKYGSSKRPGIGGRGIVVAETSK